jgi:hypothetical protein
MPNNFPITKLDQLNHEIVSRRLIQFDARSKSPRQGDYVDFADGISRRVSHVYDEEWGEEYAGVQTSDGGSWYFGGAFCSFSGALYGVAKMNTLTLTDEKRLGLVWIFHHDWHTAGGAVNVNIPFRVYKCSINAPR